MANIKTVTLTAATEATVNINGANCIIKNRTGAALYASAVSGITADADGVKYIADGATDMLRDISGKVYLLSASGGKTELEGTDFTTANFKSADSSGSALSADGTTITSDGGVLSANYINPSLLDNGWFGNGVINQRGGTSYSGSNVYTVDRWYTGSAVVTVNDDCLTVAAPNAATTASLRQKISRGAELAGKTITASVDLDLITEGSRVCLQYKYNGAWTSPIHIKNTGRQISTRTITLPAELTTDIEFAVMINTPATAGVVTQLKLYSAKIEIGGAATPFIPPEPATELIKCQRYYQIRSTNDIAAVDMRPSMGTITDITAVTGGYAYIAEL